MLSRTNARAACLILALTAGHAMAQNAPGDPVLRGPQVKDNGVPGERGSFSKKPKGAKQGKMEAPLPPRMFLGALKVLRGDDIAENVRLTPEQDDRVRAIQQEFGTSVESYMKEHGAEVRKLIPQLPPDARREADRRLRAATQGIGLEKPDRKNARPPKPTDEPMTDASPATPEQQEAVKARLKELFENAPNVKDAQGKVWMVLTDTQRPLVEVELKRLREQVAKGPKPLNKPQGVSGKPEGAPAPEVEKAPGNLRKRLQNLPPEEREEAMRRLQERRRGGKDGENKPAPDMDEVDVPPASGPK